MACREAADSSSGSGFPMNDGEATAPSNSPARASYEDEPPSRRAFDIEDTNTMQRKRENDGGREIPGARMNKMTRKGLPSPKQVPGYLAVGGPAFPGTSRASVEKDKQVERNPLLKMFGFHRNTPKATATPTDIWGALERNREEHIARCMMRPNWEDLASDDEADDAAAAGMLRFALGAEASRWEAPERSHGGVSVEFKKYLISSAKSHASSRGENFGVHQKDTDETLRDPWGFSCRDNNMYRRVPSQSQAIDPRGAQRGAGGAPLFNPWGSLNQEAMFRRVPHPATPPRAPALHGAPRHATGPPPSDLWAPLNLEIKYVSTVPIVTPPLGADDARRRVVGYRPPAAGGPEARAVEPEIVPDRVASKKPVVLLTPDDFLTFSNTDVSSMLGRVNSDKNDTASAVSDGGSNKTEHEVSDGSDKGSLTVSDQGKDDSESDHEGSDEDEEYIHPMQVISDSIDKVDSWLQKHSDVLSSGVHAAARVVDDAPLYDMPADDEVVERCQDIKRREFESTLDLARRKLRANSIKFERVAARFEKLYNEHLLEKCWLDELEAMKRRMSMKRSDNTKRNETPAPADINAPGPSGVARK